MAWTANLIPLPDSQPSAPFFNGWGTSMECRIVVAGSNCWFVVALCWLNRERCHLPFFDLSHFYSTPILPVSML